MRSRLLKAIALTVGLAGSVFAGPSSPPAGNYILNVSTLVSKPATNISSITVRTTLGLGYGTTGYLLWLNPSGVATTTTTLPTGGDVFQGAANAFTKLNTFASSTTLSKQVTVQTTGAGQAQGVGGSILVNATNETGMPVQIYSSSANQAGFFGMINLINSNTNYANAMVYISGVSSSTAKADLYITNPNPNIQFVQTGVVSPVGQYEFMVLGDTLQFRSMNAGGSAYKPRIGMTHPGALALYETSDNGHFVALKASAAITTSVTWVLPAADGTNGQAIITNGGGVLSFGSFAPTSGSANYWNSPSTGTFVGSLGIIGSSITAQNEYVMPDSTVLKSTTNIVSSTATVTIGHCAQFSASNGVTDAGAACGTAGATVLLSSGIAFGSATNTVTSNTNTLRWTDSLKTMNITGNIVISSDLPSGFFTGGLNIGNPEGGGPGQWYSPIIFSIFGSPLFSMGYESALNGVGGGFYWGDTSGNIYARLDQVLTASQFVNTDANKNLVSYDLFNATPIYNGQAKWTSTQPSTFTALNVTYNVNAGSMTGAGLTSCSAASSAVTWNSTTDQFGCNTITGGGGGGSGSIVNNATNAYQVPYYLLPSSNTLSASANLLIQPSSVTVAASLGETVTYGVTAGSVTAPIMNVTTATLASVTVTSNTILSGTTFYLGGPINMTAPMNVSGVSTVTYTGVSSVVIGGNGSFQVSSNTILSGTTFYQNGSMVLGTTSSNILISTSANMNGNKVINAGSGTSPGDVMTYSQNQVFAVCYSSTIAAYSTSAAAFSQTNSSCTITLSANAASHHVIIQAFGPTNIGGTGGAQLSIYAGASRSLCGSVGCGVEAAAVSESASPIQALDSGSNGLTAGATTYSVFIKAVTAGQGVGWGDTNITQSMKVEEVP